jgi:sugar phosphate isomerase/epimerase
MKNSMLAITTDYFQSEGDPQPYLKRIAEAGFTHIHWCHHWATDFIYSIHEIKQIAGWLKEYRLSLLNLHASHGKEKYWVSQIEYQRLAGIELVKNRIQMTARLGGDVLIVHIPSTKPLESRPAWLRIIRKSLVQVEPYTRSHNVRIALENMARDDWEMLETLLPEYDPGFLGLCFDSGHANLSGHDFTHLDQLKHRLIAVHFHDNDGITDQHKIPFSGTVDWNELANVVACSAYDQCVNLEVDYQDSDYQTEEAFLQHARRSGEQLTEMIQAKRMIE